MQLENNQGPAYNLELNRPLMDAYAKIYEEINREFDTDEQLNPDFFLQLRDAVINKPVELDADKLKKAINELMCQALDSLDSMRLKEGKAIEDDFKKRLALLESYIDKIEERAPFVVTEYKDKLKNKIELISENIEVDENRLAQEVALFAGRCDITEEIVRARSHLDQFHNYLTVNKEIRTERLLLEKYPPLWHIPN